MSTENILLFSVFIVIYIHIQKRCKQSVKTRLQRFLFFILSYRCPAKEPDSDIVIYTLFS